MSEIRTGDLVTALTRKGFAARAGGRHKEILVFWFQGRATQIRTLYSHGVRKLDDHRLRIVARELGLSRVDLLKLVECPLTGERYAGKLLAKGLIQPS